MGWYTRVMQYIRKEANTMIVLGGGSASVFFAGGYYFSMKEKYDRQVEILTLQLLHERNMRELHDDHMMEKLHHERDQQALALVHMRLNLESKIHEHAIGLYKWIWDFSFHGDYEKFREVFEESVKRNGPPPIYPFHPLSNSSFGVPSSPLALDSSDSLDQEVSNSPEISPDSSPDSPDSSPDSLNSSPDSPNSSTPAKPSKPSSSSNSLNFSKPPNSLNDLVPPPHPTLPSLPPSVFPRSPIVPESKEDSSSLPVLKLSTSMKREIREREQTSEAVSREEGGAIEMGEDDIRDYISVKISNRLGQGFILQVPPETRVSDLKWKVEEYFLIPPEQQRLYFKGIKLFDGPTLEDYEITNGSTIYLRYTKIPRNFLPESYRSREKKKFF